MSFNLDALFDCTKTITKDKVEAVRQDGNPHRIHFATSHKEQPRRTAGAGYCGKFEVPYFNSVGPVFEADTGFDLFSSKFGGYWRSIKNEAEFALVREWVERQGTRVFLRDCLDMSIALDLNFSDPTSGQHTVLGDLEGRAKHGQDQAAIAQLVDHYADAIRDLSRYQGARYIAAVPARPGKSFDLPTVLAERIATAVGKVNLTPHFSFSGDKQSIKALSVEQKWDTWEAAGLNFGLELDGSDSVILIDDKYQSGTTIQFVASRLYAAGAGEVLGLCAVKTMRDTDNT